MIAVPIKSYKRNDERLQAIIKNCDPACLFAENDYTNEHLKNCSIFNISNLLQEQERELSAPDAKNSDIAYLQYTSGSIALPKGIKISFANLSANLSMIKNHFMHDESTVIAGGLPLYHDMGFYCRHCIAAQLIIVC